jgi:exonuclease SbcD
VSVRILHTSDWHLGRTFHGAPLLDEQRAAVERVVSLAAEHRVDLVVVAGDLFDRAVPPAAAVDLLDDALAELHGTGARVAAISGNHDSAIRLGVNDRLLNRVGVSVRGQVSRVAEPLLIDDLADGGPPVAVYLLPYLEPSVVGPQLDALAPAPAPLPDDGTLFDVAELDRAVQAARAAGSGAGDAAEGGAADEAADAGELARRARPGHDQVTRAAAARARAHLATLGRTRSVVVAHAFVAGGQPSESERDLSVGNVERVGVDAFDGFDLITLGHLHRAQALGGERMAYCGTPLPYSFSEEGQAKSVRIIELSPDGSVTAETVPLGVGRPLRTLTGPLDDLLTNARFADAAEARVRVRLTDRHLPSQAMARVRQRFPHAVELRHLPTPTPGRIDGPTPADERRGRSPLDLALAFWADQHGSPATPAEHDLLSQALAGTLQGADG